MARIRTVKPKFFRHEGLQDLERQHAGSYPMLVYIGLWTACDRFGRFDWNARQLKLDILPFLEFDMGSTLELLADANQLISYEAGGKRFGYIPKFLEHQRITGTEAKSDGQYPEPPRNTQSVSIVLPPLNTTNELQEERHGNNIEAPAKQLGRLERSNRKGGVEGNPSPQTPDDLMQAVATELRISDRWVKVSISEQIRLAMEAGDKGLTVAEQMIAAGRKHRSSKDFKFGEWKKYFSTDNWKRAGPQLDDKLPNVNDERDKQRKEAELIGG